MRKGRKQSKHNISLQYSFTIILFLKRNFGSPCVEIFTGLFYALFCLFWYVYKPHLCIYICAELDTQIDSPLFVRLSGWARVSVTFRVCACGCFTYTLMHQTQFASICTNIRLISCIKYICTYYPSIFLCFFVFHPYFYLTLDSGSEVLCSSSAFLSFQMFLPV